MSLAWRRRRDPGPWRAGNRVTLLENGEQFFPRAFAAIAGAQREIIVETFILFEDRVGRDLQRALIQAANRGVRVAITVDGYGSPEFSKTFLSEMIGAGVEVHVFDPRATWMGVRLNLFRRLHRKLLVVEPDAARRSQVQTRLADPEVIVTAVADASAALRAPIRVQETRGSERTNRSATSARGRPSSSR